MTPGSNPGFRSGGPSVRSIPERMRTHGSKVLPFSPSTASAAGATRLRRRCPTVGVLYGWQVFGGDLDVYLGSLVTGLTAAARREGVNLLTTVAVGSSARNAAPAWPSLGTNRIFSPVGPW